MILNMEIRGIKEKHVKLMILIQLKLFSYPKSMRHGQTRFQSIENSARNLKIIILKEIK